MLTRAQMIAKVELQKPFLNFPNVREPFISEMYCRHCQEVSYTLRCCKSIWCPICNLKLAARMADYMKQLRDVLAKKYKMFMITLTFKNLEHITPRDFKRMRHIFIKKFLRAKKVKALILGGFYSFDWTISTNYPKDPFNIHIHILGFTEQFVPYYIIRDQWYKATGDSWRVHLSPVENINNAMKEVCDYVQNTTKLLNVDKEKRWELFDALDGVRRFAKFGIAYRIKLPRNKSKCRSCKSVGWALRPEY